MWPSEPLRVPTPWPPPDFPSGEAPRGTLCQLPLVDSLVVAWQRRRRRQKHVYATLAPIERQIIDQLVARPKTSDWPGVLAHRRIAELVGAAVAQEKRLSHVAVHPDDLAELLFWGAEDDLTPLVFNFGLRKELGISLSMEAFAIMVAKRMTVAELCEFCLRKAASNALGG